MVLSEQIYWIFPYFFHLHTSSHPQNQSRKMGLGILEPGGRGTYVPGWFKSHNYISHANETIGTENVYERDNVLEEISDKLKKRGDIILVPQPTDDPNDPLVRLPSQGLRKSDSSLELASMEEGLYLGRPLSYLFDRLDFVASSSSQHRYNYNLLD